MLQLLLLLLLILQLRFPSSRCTCHDCFERFIHTFLACFVVESLRTCHLLDICWCYIQYDIYIWIYFILYALLVVVVFCQLCDKCFCFSILCSSASGRRGAWLLVLLVPASWSFDATCSDHIKYNNNDTQSAFARTTTVGRRRERTETDTTMQLKRNATKRERETITITITEATRLDLFRFNLN